MKIKLPGRFRSLKISVWLPLILMGQLWATGLNAKALSAPEDQQSTVVSGKITSGSDKEAIPGVNVLIKGTVTGTVTDADGNYRLEVPNAEATLVFSSIGFETQEVVVGSRAVIDVALVSSTTALGEVVVVAYGTQEKISMTNAVVDVKGDELVRRPVTSLQQSLQGQMPGVAILDRGGQPGSSNAQISIRGINKPYTPVGLDQTQTSTIGDNQPLVIVDGIEQPYQYINPQDVESISVLKDASSSAIYGSRASNGVILITTKRAKDSKVTVNYSGFMSIQQAVNVPKAMDLNSYLALENLAYANVGSATPPAQPQYTNAGRPGYVAGNARDPLKYPAPYDWFNQMYKSAPMVNNALSVSGGSENVKLRLSLRNQNQQGIIANTDSKLTEVRLGTDFKLSSKINISADLDYRYQNNLEPHGITDIFRFQMQNAIWAVPKYPNGTYGGGTQGNSPLLLAENGGTNTVITDYIFGAVKGSWEITKGLTFTSQLGMRSQNTYGKDFTNTWQTQDSVTIKKSNLNNSLTETRIVDREITWNNLMNYNLNIGDDHSIKALGGYAMIYHTNSTISAYRQNFYNNDVQSIGQGINDATKTNSGSDLVYSLRSYFGRVNYAYKGKYLLEVNGRYDGSSKFSKEHQYAFFPSASVGWRISDENFWSSIRDVASGLKLRGSWGQTGNQAIPAYNFYPSMVPVTNAFNNIVAQGYEQRVAADPSLTWETVTQTDIGMDGELFNGKVFFTVDYYYKSSSGILLTLPVPGALGLQPGVQNAGTIENQGWEFLLGTRQQFGKFRLNASANFSINNNKVLNLKGTGPYIQGNDIDPRYITGEGYPVNGFWGYKTAGLYQTQADASADPVFMRAAKPGDVKMVDLNGDGKIDPSDMTFLGNSIPQYYFGSTINLAYGAFSLNILLQGSGGNYMRIARALGEAGNFEGFTPDIYTNNYWTPEHTDARFARPTKLDLRNQASTDRMLVDATYLRVKNVQLSYQLPESLIKKVSMQRANVYFSGTNLLTWSALNEWHLDPESSSGWQNYYPQTMAFTLGVNVTF